VSARDVPDAGLTPDRHGGLRQLRPGGILGGRASRPTQTPLSQNPPENESGGRLQGRLIAPAWSHHTPRTGRTGPGHARARLRPVTHHQEPGFGWAQGPGGRSRSQEIGGAVLVAAGWGWC